MQAKRMLLEHVLPKTPDIVAEMLEGGSSWRAVARRVSADSGITVSHESMRIWYEHLAADRARAG